MTWNDLIPEQNRLEVIKYGERCNADDKRKNEIFSAQYSVPHSDKKMILLCVLFNMNTFDEHAIQLNA